MDVIAYDNEQCVYVYFLPFVSETLLNQAPQTFYSPNDNIISSRLYQQNTAEYEKYGNVEHHAWSDYMWKIMWLTS